LTQLPAEAPCNLSAAICYDVS